MSVTDGCIDAKTTTNGSTSDNNYEDVPIWLISRIFCKYITMFP